MFEMSKMKLKKKPNSKSVLKLNSKSISLRLRPLRALLVDCDGILTDAKVWYEGQNEWKRFFNLRDGYGIKKLIDSGFIVGVITASQSEDIRQRVKSLKIPFFYEGSFEKLKAYEDFKKKTKLKDNEIAYMGDDDPDVPLLQVVGFSATVKDALPSALDASSFISRFRGGDGAVREVSEMIIQNSNYFRSKTNAKI